MFSERTVTWKGGKVGACWKLKISTILENLTGEAVSLVLSLTSTKKVHKNKKNKNLASKNKANLNKKIYHDAKEKILNGYRRKRKSTKE